MADRPYLRNALDSLEALVEHFENRSRRAEARLREAKGKFWHFALVGFRAQEVPLSSSPLFRIDEVPEPPGEVELATALQDSRLWSAIGRYSAGIRHELLVNRELLTDDDRAFNLAWHFMAALRAKSTHDFLVPAVAERSWGSMAAIRDQSCRAQVLEDYPRARRLTPEPGVVSAGDFAWAEENLASFLRCRADARFVVASDALSSVHHIDNPRLRVANLWAGIEALFGIQAELRFRVATMAASALEPRGAGRVARYKKILRMYDVRSKAVHGSSIDRGVLGGHTRDARRLLAALVCHFTELGHVPDAGEFESLFFGVE